ncbi:hypothetical protein O1L44_04095 [Streptomyces noursei]|nr:hypothetical protein [Streptomyces noursei]
MSRRTYLVTGAASGIGRATAARLRDDGHTVLGADLQGTEIAADLATPAGRTELTERADELTGGRLDAVIACAGLAHFRPLTLRVNYFGAVATLEGLRPCSPRAAIPAPSSSPPSSPSTRRTRPSSTPHWPVTRKRPLPPPRPPSTGVRATPSTAPPSTPSPAGCAAPPSPTTGRAPASRSMPSLPARSSRR